MVTSPELLRVVTFNLWNDRANPRRRLEVVAEGLRALEPDLVALQEVRQTADLDQAGELARELGLFFAFSAVDPDSEGGPIGNAVLSRWPIDRQQELRLPGPPGDLRGALLVEVDAGGLPVRLASVHLSWEPELAPVRETQVLALDSALCEPDGGLCLMAGDFNTGPGARAIRYLTGQDSLEGRGTFFRDAFARRHPHDDGFTYSRANPCTVRWIEQNRRIDYVFVKGSVVTGGRGSVEEARVVLDHPAADGTWPSDHFGVLAAIRLRPAAESAAAHPA